MHPFSLILGAALVCMALLVHRFVMRRAAAKRARVAQDDYDRHMAAFPRSRNHTFRAAQVFVERQKVGECQTMQLGFGQEKTDIVIDAVMPVDGSTVDLVGAVLEAREVRVDVLLGTALYMTFGKMMDGSVRSDARTGELVGSFRLRGAAPLKAATDAHVVQRTQGGRPQVVFDGKQPASSNAPALTAANVIGSDGVLGQRLGYAVPS